MSSASVARVQQVLAARGVATLVRELSASARTAAEAAQSLGCEVAQIAKSLVFVGEDGRHLLVIASGANRVDEAKVGARFGQPLKRATAEQVRELSGFAIGGVAPIAHMHEPAAIFIDEDLLTHEVIWAAAGSPHAVMSLTASQLVAMTEGVVVQVT